MLFQTTLPFPPSPPEAPTARLMGGIAQLRPHEPALHSDEPDYNYVKSG